jgi:hypothetical protein
MERAKRLHFLVVSLFQRLFLISGENRLATDGAGEALYAGYFIPFIPLEEVFEFNSPLRAYPPAVTTSGTSYDVMKNDPTVPFMLHIEGT